MAQKSTIYKANLSVANMNLNHYQDYSLTLAQHPSETLSRMMFRLAVFAILAQEEPQFCKGISSEEEPDLWCLDLTGQITHWIELGHPEEKRLRQACGKARKVSVFPYQAQASSQWFQGAEKSMERFAHLEVTQLSVLEKRSLEDLVQKSMDLSCTLQDDELWFSSPQDRIGLSLTPLKTATLGR